VTRRLLSLSDSGLFPAVCAIGDRAIMNNGVHPRAWSANRPTRRTVLKGLAGGVTGLTLSPWLVGCAKGESSSGPKALRIANLGVSSADPTMDPAKATSFLPALALFDRLTALKADGTVIPSLATGWHSSADLTRWTFTLRRGVTFHDGRAMTADDVVRSLQRVLNPATGSYAYSQLAPFLTAQDVSKTDDHTVTLRLRRGYWGMPTLLAQTATSVVPATVRDEETITKPIGTGAYVFAEQVPGDHFIGTRNPHYWRSGYPKNSEIRVYYVADSAQRASGLLAGQFDLVTGLSPADLRVLNGKSRVQVHAAKANNVKQFAMLASEKPFDDQRVWTAVKLAVDRAAMRDIAWQGQAALASDEPILTTSTLAVPPPQRQRDIARAKTLLAQAGYLNGFDIDVHVNAASPGMVNMATLLKSHLADAGVRVTVKPEPVETWTANYTSGKFRFFGLSTYALPGDLAIPALYGPLNGGLDVFHWADSQVAQRLADAQGEPDERRRRSKYADLLRYISGRSPSVIPVLPYWLEATAGTIDGYDVSGYGNCRDVWQIEVRG